MTNSELVQQIKNEIETENQEPVLRFSLKPGQPGLTESKVGGTPYLPRGMEWPLDDKGIPMTLLAQVNCAELKGLPDFPHSGLLQFFVGLNDVFGADFEDIQNNNGFRVLYHETVDSSVTAEEAAAKKPPVPDGMDSEYMTPLLAESCRLCFGAPEMQGMTDGDYRYNGRFCAKWNQRRPDEPIQSIWEISGVWDNDDGADDDYAEGTEHQMGGYPYFTQTDPRWEGKYPELDVVLFQLDSDMHGETGDMVLWGDCGVGNFFINREALRRRDFSRVGYNWDCC